LITRTAVLAPATLAALQSTRAIETRSLPSSLAATHRGFAFYVAFPKRSIPNRDVFCVADPISSIVSRLLPLGSNRCPRGFTGHVADPLSSIRFDRFLGFFVRGFHAS
jgi:hypothetical protein